VRDVRRWTIAVVALAVPMLLLTAPAAEPSRGLRAAVSLSAPDIVLILTDDQRWDTLDAMPKTRALLADRGMTFTNAFVSNSSCCPSRVSILTGDYSHTTGVYTSGSGPYGGFQSFDDSSSAATWLRAKGYRTAMIGKYLNGYLERSGYVPPGWDRWFALGGTQPGYFDYLVSDDGNPRRFGHAQADYSTDVFAATADRFIRTTPSSQPLFLYFAPRAPHGPATPPKRYARSFSDLAPYRPPSYEEADVSDKPQYVRNLSRTDSTAADDLRRNQYRTLLAVDDAVERIVTALSDTGRLDHTMVVFTSDNGLTWGEHRLRVTKFTPYDEAIRVPLIVRYDGVTAGGSVDDHIVGNIDLAPTFAQISGAQAPAMDGSSLMPLLTRSPVLWRPGLLLEHMPEGQPQAPTFCGIRVDGFSLVSYASGETELYDVTDDPYQLQNVASLPAYVGVLEELLAQLPDCAPSPAG
jgi:N-acetylglucosamine-6-sulfatase